MVTRLLVSDGVLWTLRIVAGLCGWFLLSVVTGVLVGRALRLPMRRTKGGE